MRIPMRKAKRITLIAAALAALLLSGCQMTGSAIQGVGGVFNKAGGAVRNLGS